MFRTDAAFPPGHLLKYITIIELLPFFQNYVYVEIAISDVPVANDFGFGLAAQLFTHYCPLFHIERNVVR